MIRQDDVKKQLEAEWSHKVIPTNAKRVIVPLPEGLKGQTVQYKTWDNQDAEGSGFLFLNATDKREEFLQADGGIIIGHEGECPEGIDGTMISRSEAVAQYMKKHPDALSDHTHIAETIAYLQQHVFRHAQKDVTQWDANAVPDIWTSDMVWLKKNFNEADIYDDHAQIKPVISAAKSNENAYDVVYFGPNAEIEGIGASGDNGSWAVRQPDGMVNLCTEEVFNKTYKSKDPAQPAKVTIENGKITDVRYPKGSMRWMPEDNDPYARKVSLEERMSASRNRCKELETPVLRVLGAALCDYIEQHPGNTTRLELEVNGLMAMDKNKLSADVDNAKSRLLMPLVDEKIIDSTGKILNVSGLANSPVIKDFKGQGVDLTTTPTIENLRKRQLSNSMSAQNLSNFGLKR